MTTTALYGPSAHNQLTLVTSASSSPWNSSQAVVVVARLKGEPYTPTPQESRSTSQQGDTGDPAVLPWFLLALLVLAAAFAGAVALYRRTSLRSAYLLTTAPILVAAILVAEALTRLLPAWT
jgi:sortase A